MTQQEKLFSTLMGRGYPESFCLEVCKFLHTDYTAGRMLGYLAYYDENLPVEEIADEVISILSDRQRFIDKAETEKANASYNEFLNRDRP